MQEISHKQLTYLLKKYGSDQKVAQSLKVSRQTIHNLRKKYSIPSVSKNIKGRNLIIREKYSHGVSPQSLSGEYQLSINHIYHILRDSSLKSSAQFPQQQILTLEQYRRFKESEVFDRVTEITVTTTPLTPTTLSDTLLKKETILLVKVLGKNMQEYRSYAELYSLLKGVDYVVGMLNSEDD